MIPAGNDHAKRLMGLWEGNQNHRHCGQCADSEDEAHFARPRNPLHTDSGCRGVLGWVTLCGRTGR